MNKYLDRLKSKINVLPENYVKEIMVDYESHFYEAMEFGKSEEEIIKELGDIEYVANSIIAEYYIENSNKINSVKSYSKAVRAVFTAGVGTLNILIMLPIILSVLIVIASMYFTAGVFVASPVLFIIHLLIPQIPISFGADILLVEIIVVALMTIGGTLILKNSKEVTKKVFTWSFTYIIKSVKFKAIKIDSFLN